MLHKVHPDLTHPKGWRGFQTKKKEAGVGFSQSFFNLKRKECDSRSNVKKKAKKCISYTHRFVCLSKIDQESIPTTDREKDAFLEAGLGEKKIIIPDIDINGEDFRDILCQEFCKLKDGGGFMFAKCKGNSRLLEPLSPLCLTSPRILRDRVGNARTYILPLQKDLDLTAIVKLPAGVMPSN